MRRGITQETLAARIGRKQSYLSKVESGHLQPGFHEVLNVLQLLGAESPTGLFQEPTGQGRAAVQNAKGPPISGGPFTCGSCGKPARS